MPPVGNLRESSARFVAPSPPPTDTCSPTGIPVSSLNESSQRLRHPRTHRWPLRCVLAYSCTFRALLAAGLACAAPEPRSGAVWSFASVCASGKGLGSRRLAREATPNRVSPEPRTCAPETAGFRPSAVALACSARTRRSDSRCAVVSREPHDSARVPDDLLIVAQTLTGVRVVNEFGALRAKVHCCNQ